MHERELLTVGGRIAPLVLYRRSQILVPQAQFICIAPEDLIDLTVAVRRLVARGATRTTLQAVLLLGREVLAVVVVDPVIVRAEGLTLRVGSFEHIG